MKPIEIINAIGAEWVKIKIAEEHINKLTNSNHADYDPASNNMVRSASVEQQNKIIENALLAIDSLHYELKYEQDIPEAEKLLLPITKPTVNSQEISDNWANIQRGLIRLSTYWGSKATTGWTPNFMPSSEKPPQGLEDYTVTAVTLAPELNLSENDFIKRMLILELTSLLAGKVSLRKYGQIRTLYKQLTGKNLPKSTRLVFQQANKIPDHLPPETTFVHLREEGIITKFKKLRKNSNDPMGDARRVSVNVRTPQEITLVQYAWLQLLRDPNMALWATRGTEAVTLCAVLSCCFLGYGAIATALTTIPANAIQGVTNEVLPTFGEADQESIQKNIDTLKTFLYVMVGFGSAMLYCLCSLPITWILLNLKIVSSVLTNFDGFIFEPNEEIELDAESGPIDNADIDAIEEKEEDEDNGKIAELLDEPLTSIATITEIGNPELIPLKDQLAALIAAAKLAAEANNADDISLLDSAKAMIQALNAMYKTELSPEAIAIQDAINLLLEDNFAAGLKTLYEINTATPQIIDLGVLIEATKALQTNPNDNASKAKFYEAVIKVSAELAALAGLKSDDTVDNNNDQRTKLYAAARAASTALVHIFEDKKKIAENAPASSSNTTDSTTRKNYGSNDRDPHHQLQPVFDFDQVFGAGTSAAAIKKAKERQAKIDTEEKLAKAQERKIDLERSRPLDEQPLLPTSVTSTPATFGGLGLSPNIN